MITAHLPLEEDVAAPRRWAIAALWLSRAGLAVAVGFLSVSLAGLQIGLGVSVAGLIALRVAGGRAWTRTALDLPVLSACAGALLGVVLPALAGQPTADPFRMTLWKTLLVLPLAVAVLEAQLPGAPADAPRRRALAALAIWAAAAMVPSALAWVQTETGFDLLHAMHLRGRAIVAEAPQYPGHYAAVGFFPWYPQFAHNLVPPLGVLAAVALFAPLPRRTRLLLGAAALAVASAVVATFSRAAWVSVGAMGALLALLARRRASRLAMPAVLGAFAVLSIATPGVRDRLGTAFDRVENGDRLAIWRVCAAVARDHPVTGVGFGRIGDVMPGYQERLRTGSRINTGCHNVPLTLFAEGGPALLAAGLLYWGLLARVFHRWRRGGDALGRAASAGALAAILGILVNGMFHDVMHESHAMYALALALAIAAVLARPRDADAPA